MRFLTQTLLTATVGIATLPLHAAPETARTELLDVVADHSTALTVQLAASRTGSEPLAGRAREIEDAVTRFLAYQLRARTTDQRTKAIVPAALGETVATTPSDADRAIEDLRFEQLQRQAAQFHWQIIDEQRVLKQQLRDRLLPASEKREIITRIRSLRSLQRTNTRLLAVAAASRRHQDVDSATQPRHDAPARLAAPQLTADSGRTPVFVTGPAVSSLTTQSSLPYPRSIRE